MFTPMNVMRRHLVSEHNTIKYNRINVVIRFLVVKPLPARTVIDFCRFYILKANNSPHPAKTLDQ